MGIPGIYKFLVVGVLLVTIYGAAYFYYTSTQKELKALREANIQLVTANKQNEATINKMLRDAKANEEARRKVNNELEEAEEYQKMLLKKLQKHDLTRLTAEKPGLIQKRINDATKKVFDDLESATAKQ